MSNDLQYLSIPFNPTFRLVTTSPNKVKSTTPNQKESPLNKFPADFEFSPEYRVCMGQAEIDRIMKFTPSASTVRSQVAKSKDFQVRQSAELVRLGQG